MTSDDTTRNPEDDREELDITELSLKGRLNNSSASRRTFLKAAALGAAAAAVVGRSGSGSLRLGSSSVYAHDISTFQCTSNDVRIPTAGQIINEPCDCTGTFNAIVQFTVTNNAASARNCITLHLCPVTLPNGTIFNPGDVLLDGIIAGKTTKTMTGTINNYPCGSGLLCFGVAVPDGRGRCDAGTCCSTVTWGVPGQDTCPPDHLISSKCRHQQICIQGRGATTLDCDTSLTGVQDNCAIECGTNATLRACTTNAAGLGPFTYVLSDGQTFGPTTETCHDFVVGPITDTATYTVTITDKDGCAKSDSVTLTTSAVDTPLLSAGAADCEGDVTLTVTNCDPALTYTYTEVDCTSGATIGTLGSGVGLCSLSVNFPPGSSAADHCVVVTASNGSAACDATSEPVTIHINAVVAVDLAVTGQGNCDGVLTFTATATGGTGSYTYTFSVDGVQAQSGASNTFSYGPVLDGACHTVSVAVQDSAGCPAAPATDSIAVSQCAETTFC
jgi:hypothetical protein